MFSWKNSFLSDISTWREKGSEHPRAVLRMFDVSARPFVRWDVLSFSVPMKKSVMMTGNMKESFLITQSWSKIQKRIRYGEAGISAGVDVRGETETLGRRCNT